MNSRSKGIWAKTIGRALGRWLDHAGEAANQRAYAVAAIVLAAKLAKADGPVTRTEIDVFKSLFKISADEVRDVARVWNAAKRDARGFEPYARRLAILFADRPAVLENLLTALIHVGLADGPLAPAEIATLRAIAQAFGFDAQAFARLRAKADGVSAGDPYRILGVAPEASDEDVKRAWRRLVRVYHPDTAIARGRPRELIEIATGKMAAINAAYEAIERSRARA